MINIRENLSRIKNFSTGFTKLDKVNKIFSSTPWRLAYFKDNLPIDITEQDTYLTSNSSFHLCLLYFGFKNSLKYSISLRYPTNNFNLNLIPSAFIRLLAPAGRLLNSPR